MGNRIIFLLLLCISFFGGCVSDEEDCIDAYHDLSEPYRSYFDSIINQDTHEIKSRTFEFISDKGLSQSFGPIGIYQSSPKAMFHLVDLDHPNSSECETYKETISISYFPSLYNHDVSLQIREKDTGVCMTLYNVIYRIDKPNSPLPITLYQEINLETMNHTIYYYGDQGHINSPEQSKLTLLGEQTYAGRTYEDVWKIENLLFKNANTQESSAYIIHTLYVDTHFGIVKYETINGDIWTAKF
jgi:hypothetical protein